MDGWREGGREEEERESDHSQCLNTDGREGLYIIFMLIQLKLKGVRETGCVS